MFNHLNILAKTKVCSVTSGIADLYTGIVTPAGSDTSNKDVRLVLATQKAKQYEIDMYRELMHLAGALHYSNIEPILNKTLQEEQLVSQLFLNITDECIDPAVEKSRL